MATTKKAGGRTTPRKNQGASEQPTSASAWRSSAVQGTLIRVPSGNTCLVRPKGMEAFLKNGVIPNGLIPLIQDSMKQGQVPEDVDVSSILEDPTKLQSILELADAVVVDTVIDPKVLPTPLEGEERREDVLYVDEVDLNDKMFIFNFVVGGTANLEKFRPEQVADVGAV